MKRSSAKAEETLDAVGRSIEAVRLREGLNGAMALARETNRYLDAQAPWRLIKTDKPTAGRALYVAMRMLMALRVILYPYLPFSAQRLHELLGQSGDLRSVGWRLEAPSPGQPIPQPQPLFSKLDDAIADEMRAKLG